MNWHPTSNSALIVCKTVDRLVTSRYLSSSAEHLQVMAGSNGALLVGSRFVTRDLVKILLMPNVLRPIGNAERAVGTARVMASRARAPFLLVAP